MSVDEFAVTGVLKHRKLRAIPGYRIAEELGRGGMGVVYRATHLELQREVALKVVLPSRRIDPSFARRFLREARTVASLNHPNVVQAYDAGTANGLLYLSLELVEGEDLDSYLRRRGRLAPREAVRIVLDAARGLAHAHGSAAQIVHRDVKPSNLLRTLRDDGSPLIKLTDFGLARTVRGGSRSRLTEPDQVVGSPRYMSPEQIEGKALDHRSDIYSLGATFYELLVGRPPHVGSNVRVLAKVVARADYPSPSKRLGRRLPSEIERVLARMLDYDRGARYADYASLIADLEALLAAGPCAPATKTPTRSARVALAGCAAALLGLVLACDMPNPPAPAPTPDFADLPELARYESPALERATPRRQAAPRRQPAPAREAPDPWLQPRDPWPRAEPTPALEAPAPAERCSVRLLSEVEGAQAFVNGEPVSLPGSVTAERGAELEVVVTAPGALPLRRVVRADEITLELNPHSRLSHSPARLAHGRLFPEQPRTWHSRDIEPTIRGEIVPVASPEPGLHRSARVDHLVVSGEGWARLPLWRAAQALANEEGKVALGWAFAFGLETEGQSTLELSTLSGEGRDLVLRVRGERLELGARSANDYSVLGQHDLVHPARALRLEWTGTHVRVSFRSADTMGGIFHPVFTHRVDWSPSHLGTRIQVFDLDDDAQAKLTDLDLATLGAAPPPKPRKVSPKQRLRLTSSVPGARAFVGGAAVELPHELEASADAEVSCVVVAPGHSPLRRVVRAGDGPELRLDPVPQDDAWGDRDRGASLAVFPWLPDTHEGRWHIAERVSEAGDRRVPHYVALRFDNPRGASMTAELEEQLEKLAAKTGTAEGWSLELGLEFDGAGTFECTPLRGAEGELSVRLRGSRLELLERPHDGQPRVVATHDLVTPPSTLRLEWNGTAARVSTTTLLNGGRLQPALVYAPRWSDLELGAARFSFADLEEFAILQCPRVTLLKP